MEITLGEYNYKIELAKAKAVQKEIRYLCESHQICISYAIGNELNYMMSILKDRESIISEVYDINMPCYGELKCEIEDYYKVKFGIE